MRTLIAAFLLIMPIAAQADEWITRGPDAGACAASITDFRARYHRHLGPSIARDGDILVTSATWADGKREEIIVARRGEQYCIVAGRPLPAPEA